MAKKKTSIATLAMKKIGARISLVVILTTLASYWFLKEHLVNKHYTTLLNTVSERVLLEQALFPEVEEFLKDMNEQMSKDSSFMQMDIEQEFRRMFEFRDDGSIRHKKNNFHSEKSAGVYVDDSTKLTAELKERIIRFHYYNNLYGRALNSKYTNLYILGAENYLLVYWPEFLWTEEVTTDYRIWDEPYYSVATPENNPDKQAVWTPIYYDEVAHRWMVSCIVPLYLAGEHIASSGMDILLNDLIRRTEIEVLEGSSNIIITKEGKLIFHQDYNDRILESKGSLSVFDCQDPVLEKIYQEVSENHSSSKVSLLPKSSIPYAVAYGQINGPDWYYITLYENEAIWSGVSQGVKIVFLSAIFALLIELLIVFNTLSKNIKHPLFQLIVAIKSIIRGDFTKSIAKSKVREIEEIRLAFNKMQDTISSQITSLKERKEEVEREIENRKQAEEDRLIAYNQLQNIMNSSNLVSIIATDTKGVITHFNSGAQRMLGYTDKEIIGKHSPALIHIDSEIEQRSESLYQEYGERIQGFEVFIYEARQGKYLEKEWTYVRKDGSQITVRLVITPIHNSNQDIVGYLGIALDITEQKKAEKALIDYRDNLELLVKEKTKDLNAANEELNAVNESLLEKNQIIEEKNQELQEALEDLKGAQAQLLHSEKMASLGILTAGIAHEINNPLNYLMGAYVGLLRHFENDSFSENQEEIGTLIHALKTGIDRSSAIVQGLNQFSRKSDSHDEDCDLHAIINNSLTILHNQLKHHIQISKKFFDKDIFIKGNVGNLHQAFINILTNAAHSIDGEGTISIRTTATKTKAIIEIEDTGHGIPDDHLEKVTDPFFTTKDPGKGTGLGLSITYNIIKEHNGNLELKSKMEKGTIVKLTFPKHHKA